MKTRVVADVSELPTYAHGPESGPWWGSAGFMALEGTGFALSIAAYYYLYAVNPRWPLNSPPPDLWPGTALTALLVLSVIPNMWLDRVAHAEDLHKTRLGLNTTHIVTDLGDTLVLTALMFTRHGHGRRFSDVTDNCFYWNFVVLTWIPLYLMLDWTPRL